MLAFTFAVLMTAAPADMKLFQPCPVTGKACQCGCADGRPCTCAKKSLGGGVWCPDADGSKDYGWFVGGRFVGRWFAAANEYREWDGGKYGPVVPLVKPERKIVGWKKQCSPTGCRLVPVYE